MPYIFSIPFTRREQEIRKHILEALIRSGDMNISQIKKYVKEAMFYAKDDNTLWVLWKTIAVEAMKYDTIDPTRPMIDFYKGPNGPKEIRFRLVKRNK